MPSIYTIKYQKGACKFKFSTPSKLNALYCYIQLKKSPEYDTKLIEYYEDDNLKEITRDDYIDILKMIKGENAT